MKFEYEKEKDRGECVAYIDEGGDLRIAISDGEMNVRLCIETGIIMICTWDPEKSIKRFYPGDKITITF